jgi:AraC family chemosensory pili system transcriptional regulator ChpD
MTTTRSVGNRSAAVALDGCVITRPSGFDGAVEIVAAQSVTRSFPTHVSESLGICLKVGAAHDVISDGKHMTYPADSVCVRAPGCVWSCEAAPVGFLSIDVASTLLPDDVGPRSMRFLPRAPELDLQHVASRLCSTDPLLREQSAVALVLAIIDCGGVDGARSIDSPMSMHRACERLRTGLDHSLSLDELARDVGINKFVLIRRFRASIGATPHHYRTLMRIERARVLLARGVSMIEIAHEVGFADQSHFSRTFKRVLGVTPGAYAQSVRGRLC